MFKYTILLSLLCTSFYSLAQKNDTTITETFELGEITITGTRSKNNTETINRKEIRMNNATSVAEAVNLLPGIAVSQAGGRNEAMVFVRGYDLRQVPVFIDGVPVYVPFDGYIDLNRLLIGNVAKISVNKGFASLLYGANTLGGAINIVTSRPVSRFEGGLNAAVNVGAEGFSGFKTSVNVGTNREKWFARASLQLHDQQFLTLPQSFDTSEYEQDYKRNNSQFRNLGYGVKAGFTPNKTNEYVVSFHGVRSNKGVPVYLGADPKTRVRFWRYPHWEKDGVFLHTKTSITPKTQLKTRWFYDTYYNKLKSFDDETYSSQTFNYAFTSIYNDQSLGGNAELNLFHFANHKIKMGLRSQFDHHQEYNEGETPRNIKDVTTVLAVEDIWNATESLKIAGGVGFLSRRGLQADDYVANVDSVSQFTPTNDESVHFQLGGFYQINPEHEISATISRKSRFATMKDRYSYRTGRAIPNPGLSSETAVNTDLGYDASWENVQLTANVFYNFISNTIQQINNVEGDLWQLQNTGKSQFRGAELAVGWKVFRQTQIGGSYTFIDQRNISNPDLKFIDVPTHTGQVYVRSEPIKNMNLQVNIKYESERISTSNGEYIAPEFIIFNAFAGYNFQNGFGLNAGVRNIFNKKYYLTEGYPEAGRVFEFSLNYRFEME